MCAKSNPEQFRFSVHSDADNDLGIFLMFTGLVGAVPLYYLFSALVLRQANFDWRFGGVLGVLLIIAGLYLRKTSLKHFRVSRSEDGGYISVRDGYFHSSVRYYYKGQPSILFNSIKVNHRRTQADCWQVTLVDGRCQYLIDQRIEKLQESRAIAEFLSKSINCQLSVHLDASAAIDVAPEDLDLPYYRRVKKYPALLGPHPNRPADCPVRITEVDNGLGRIYSWGVAASGFLADTCVALFLCVALSALPIFGEVGHHYSIIEEAHKTGDYFFFFWASILFGALFLIQLGFRFQIAVLEERINISHLLWGFTLGQKSMLVDELEEISARSCSGGTRIQLVSDNLVASLRIVDLECANYVVSDIQYHINVTKT